MQRVDVNKVFCIGFHKTGTTSMGKALEALGYAVTGPNGTRDPEIARRVYTMAERLLTQYDAFQDNPWPILYKWCHERHPDAKFILTLRDPERWYESQCKHFAGNTTPMREWIYGPGCGAPLNNKERYQERFNAHNAEVIEYFKGKDNLLVVDITQGDGWDQICPFLGKPVPNDLPFPHANPARANRGGSKKTSALKTWKRALFGREN